ncbi:MAG: hypothetical protein ABIU95_12170, partial [Burkholderiales bacterium]
MRAEPRARLAVGLIGFGAIGQVVAEAITQRSAGNTHLTAVLCRNPAQHEAVRARCLVDAPV